MPSIIETCAAIGAPNASIAAEVQRRLDFKTKPRRSLGRLEDLAVQYAAVSGNARPTLPKKAVVVMGADHGVAAQGVSAYPQEVTAQMLLNFASGGAAINVLARHAGAEVIVLDLGVASEVKAPGIESARIAAGTADMTRTAAMTREQAERALLVGIECAERLQREGVSVVGLGEMGIGNTTAASALTAAFTGAAVAEVTGYGTGIDSAARDRKIAVIESALTLHAGARKDPLDTLAAVGGFEIAGLAGLTLGAAARGMLVILDGFIASVAALVAVRMAPAAAAYLVASHRSVEAGHRIVLRELGREPLFDLQLRLGEGTGGALAMTFLDAALKVLLEMATFETAGVTDAGA